MSSFKTKARNKATGEVHEVWCIDDHFGKYQYGYFPTKDGEPMREKQFYEQYEEVE